jgi:hypothetical protein
MCEKKIKLLIIQKFLNSTKKKRGESDATPLFISDGKIKKNKHLCASFFFKVIAANMHVS